MMKAGIIAAICVLVFLVWVFAYALCKAASDWNVNKKNSYKEHDEREEENNG